MKVRKEKVKEELKNVSIQEARKKLTESYQRPTKGTKSFENLLSNSGFAIGGTVPMDKLTHEIKSMNKVENNSYEKTKIDGFEADTDDLELALKYISQIYVSVPVKSLNVVCGRCSSFTSAFITKAVGKCMPNVPEYHKQLMKLGSVSMDSIYSPETKTNAQLIFINSAKKFADLKNWRFNEALYDMVSMISDRQTLFNDKFNKNVDDDFEKIINGKVAEAVDSRIINILGEETIINIIKSLDLVTKTTGTGKLLNDAYTSQFKAIMTEYNSYSLISEIRPEALNDVMYKCGDTELRAAENYINNGVQTSLPLVYICSYDDHFDIKGESSLCILCQAKVRGTDLSEYSFDTKVLQLRDVFINLIQELNAHGNFNLINYVVIVTYYMYNDIINRINSHRDSI